jgi:hypothetical protein
MSTQTAPPALEGAEEVVRKIADTEYVRRPVDLALSFEPTEYHDVIEPGDRSHRVLHGAATLLGRGSLGVAGLPERLKACRHVSLYNRVTSGLLLLSEGPSSLLEVSLPDEGFDRVLAAMRAGHAVRLKVEVEAWLGRGLYDTNSVLVMPTVEGSFGGGARCAFRSLVVIENSSPTTPLTLRDLPDSLVLCSLRREEFAVRHGNYDLDEAWAEYQAMDGLVRDVYRREDPRRNCALVHIEPRGEKIAGPLGDFLDNHAVRTFAKERRNREVDHLVIRAAAKAYIACPEARSALLTDLLIDAEIERSLHETWQEKPVPTTGLYVEMLCSLAAAVGLLWFLGLTAPACIGAALGIWNGSRCLRTLEERSYAKNRRWYYIRDIGFAVKSGAYDRDLLSRQLERIEERTGRAAVNSFVHVLLHLSDR